MTEATPNSPFICAYQLDGKGSGEPLDETEVGNWSEDHGLLWVHLDVLNAASREWAVKNSGLDPTIAEALVTDETRPRVVPMNMVCCSCCAA